MVKGKKHEKPTVKYRNEDRSLRRPRLAIVEGQPVLVDEGGEACRELMMVIDTQELGPKVRNFRRMIPNNRIPDPRDPSWKLYPDQVQGMLDGRAKPQTEVDVRTRMATRHEGGKRGPAFDAWVSDRVQDKEDAGLPLQSGLAEIRGSGSNQFNHHALQVMLRLPMFLGVGAPLVMVDLRQEPHAFATFDIHDKTSDQQAQYQCTVTWVAATDIKDHALLGAEQDAALAVERGLADHLRNAPNPIDAWKVNPNAGPWVDEEVHENPLGVDHDTLVESVFLRHTSSAINLHASYGEQVMTEEECLRRDAEGVEYLRLCVPDHEIPENDAVIDAFVRHVRSHPDAWYHFHCRGGAGRTTTFLCLYDALRCAELKKQGKITRLPSAYDILYRQWMIGGSDLDGVVDHLSSRSEEELDKVYKTRPALDRLQFVKKFVEFAYSGAESWSAWASEHRCSVERTGFSAGNYCPDC